MDTSGILPKLEYPAQIESTLLADAKRINSDLGVHVKSCSFSLTLSGRFYQNNSMDTHYSRKGRLNRMKEKRRQLTWSLKLEEEKLKFLRKRVLEKQERAREVMEQHIFQQELSTIKIQTKTRQKLAATKLQTLKTELKLNTFIALVIQALYRGKKSRLFVDELRKRIINHRKEQNAALTIQSLMRMRTSSLELKRRKEEHNILLHNAARVIQSNYRTFISRIAIQEELLSIKKLKSAILIQEAWCKALCKMNAKRKNNDSIKKKIPKSALDRIPLHERRYSSYSILNQPKIISKNSYNRQRRFSECSKNKINAKERRSSMSGIDITRGEECKAEMFEKKSESSKILSKQFCEPCSPTSPEDSEKERIEVARQKAATRVARLERKFRREKEQKNLFAIAAKERVLQLELKRKELLKVQTSRKKQSTVERDIVEKEIFCLERNQYFEKAEKPVLIGEENLLDDNAVGQLYTTKESNASTCDTMAHGLKLTDIHNNNSNLEKPIFNEERNVGTRIKSSLNENNMQSMLEINESIVICSFEEEFYDDFSEREDDLF